MIVGTLPNALNVFNLLIPQEGPKTLPLSFDFTVASFYEVDLFAVQSRLGMSLLQTLYLDLSGTDQPLTVSVPGSVQSITVKGRTQGYYPILSPNPAKLVFTCPGGPVSLPVQLINVPIFASQWPTQ